MNFDFVVFAPYVSHGQCKPRLIFSRINGPIKWRATYNATKRNEKVRLE